MEEHIEWTAFDKLKTFQKNCDGLNKQIMDLYKAIYLFNTEKHKFIYEWVNKHYPTWVEYSTITYDLKNNAEPNYQDDISVRITENDSEICISILNYDPKSSKLASQGYEVEDSYWKTYKIKTEEFK
jgi:hypothetical protein